MRGIGLVLLAGVVLAAASVAPAATLSVRSSQDAGYDSGSNSPTSYGSTGKYGYMNADKADTRRMMMQWDLSAIPAGAIINSAVMKIVGLDPATGYAYNVAPLTSAWTEGMGMSNGGTADGMSPPTGSGANWYYRKLEGNDGIAMGRPGDSDSPLAWTTPGGDYNAAASINYTGVWTDPFVQPSNGLTYYFSHKVDIKSIVQSWVNGTANYGVLVRDVGGMDNGRVASRSRDALYPDNGQIRPAAGDLAPQLIIDYTVPEPMTMSLLALGGLGLIARRRR